MNLANALGFLVLGTLMHVAPDLTSSGQAAVVESVRTLWLELMGWLVGGIGCTYVVREGVVRLPALLVRVLPERLLQPAPARSLSVPMAGTVRVGSQ